MTVHPTRLKTVAETQLAAQFAALGDVSPARKAAFAVFEATGLPNKRIEAYHFTDLRAALSALLPLARASCEAKAWNFNRDASETLVVVRDGRFDPDLSDPMPEGVALHVLEAATSETADPVIALNLAFSEQELLLTVGAGVHVAKPVKLLALSSTAGGRAVFRHTKVVLGAGASLTLVESADGAAAPNQANVLLSLELEDGAKLSHIARIAAGQGLVLATVDARVGAHCELSSFALLSGGTLVRRQLFVALNGAHSNLSLDGVSLLRGAQHIDTTLTVTHKAAHCTSRETFRHIVQDEATGVFQGKIVVTPGAQKTDGKMMSKTILLSDNAVMNNKPELEIFADDVVCGHGATVGALDENQIFYARTRGIPKQEAQALLLEAFAGEVIDTISHQASRDAMHDHLRGWLAERKA